MKKNYEAELEALNNALYSLNLTGYKIFQSHTRKYQFCLIDDKGNYLTGCWNYEQLNHFIVGYGKAFNKLNPKPQSKSQLVNLTGRYSYLMQDVVLAIQQRLLDTDGTFDFEDNGFEDESGNDVVGVDNEDIHITGNRRYSLHELSFWDGIKVIEAIGEVKERVKQMPHN